MMDMILFQAQLKFADDTSFVVVVAVSDPNFHSVEVRCTCVYMRVHACTCVYNNNNTFSYFTTALLQESTTNIKTYRLSKRDKL